MKLDVLDRLQASGPAGWLAALAAGAWQAMRGDVFFWLLVLLALTNLTDWIFGRRAARARKLPDGRSAFSRRKSREGVNGKAVGIVIVLIIRALEAVLALAGISTSGWFATGVCAALIYEDIESLERHRGKPVPFLGTVLSKLRELTGGDRRRAERVAVQEEAP